MTISQLNFLVRWVCDQQPNNSEEGWFIAGHDWHRPHDLIKAWYTWERWERKKLYFRPRKIYSVMSCHFHRKENLSPAAVLSRLEIMRFAAAQE